ncbi:MAG: ribosome silencing factor [Lachnospiraceae bacterium]|nr:ribosome silencing factor [Lachnospiraceae bacterium]
MNTKELAALVYKALDDKKGEDVSVIDISGISVIADYFIVASANNQNHLNALQDAADEVMYKNGFSAKQVEGNRNSTWILMDYEDIIIHLFSAEDRLFYDLERIWKDGNFISEEELKALLPTE